MKTVLAHFAHTQLPALDEDLLRRTCGHGMVWSDSRRFPRTNISTPAFLQPEFTYAAAGHQSGSQDVWLRDLSRGGTRFIHGSQLFPGERCTITLSDGTRLQLEVVWCRRVAAGAFVSGCHFVVGDESQIRG